MQDMIKKMLIYDPETRASSFETLKHTVIRKWVLVLDKDKDRQTPSPLPTKQYLFSHDSQNFDLVHIQSLEMKFDRCDFRKIFLSQVFEEKAGEHLMSVNQHEQLINYMQLEYEKKTCCRSTIRTC